MTACCVLVKSTVVRQVFRTVAVFFDAGQRSHTTYNGPGTTPKTDKNGKSTNHVRKTPYYKLIIIVVLDDELVNCRFLCYLNISLDIQRRPSVVT